MLYNYKRLFLSILRLEFAEGDYSKADLESKVDKSKGGEERTTDSNEATWDDMVTYALENNALTQDEVDTIIERKKEEENLTCDDCNSELNNFNIQLYMNLVQKGLIIKETSKDYIIDNVLTPMFKGCADENFSCNPGGKDAFIQSIRDGGEGKIVLSEEGVYSYEKINQPPAPTSPEATIETIPEGMSKEVFNYIKSNNLISIDYSWPNFRVNYLDSSFDISFNPSMSSNLGQEYFDDSNLASKVYHPGDAMSLGQWMRAVEELKNYNGLSKAVYDEVQKNDKLSIVGESTYIAYSPEEGDPKGYYLYISRNPSTISNLGKEYLDDPSKESGIYELKDSKSLGQWIRAVEEIEANENITFDEEIKGQQLVLKQGAIGRFGNLNRLSGTLDESYVEATGRMISVEKAKDMGTGKGKTEDYYEVESLSGDMITREYTSVFVARSNLMNYTESIQKVREDRRIKNKQIKLDERVNELFLENGLSLDFTKIKPSREEWLDESDNAICWYIAETYNPYIRSGYDKIAFGISINNPNGPLVSGTVKGYRDIGNNGEITGTIEDHIEARKKEIDEAKKIEEEKAKLKIAKYFTGIGGSSNPATGIDDVSIADISKNLNNSASELAEKLGIDFNIISKEFSYKGKYVGDLGGTTEELNNVLKRLKAREAKEQQQPAPALTQAPQTAPAPALTQAPQPLPGPNPQTTNTLDPTTDTHFITPLFETKDGRYVPEPAEPVETQDPQPAQPGQPAQPIQPAETEQPKTYSDQLKDAGKKIGLAVKQTGGEIVGGLKGGYESLKEGIESIGDVNKYTIETNLDLLKSYYETDRSHPSNSSKEYKELSKDWKAIQEYIDRNMPRISYEYNVLKNISALTGETFVLFLEDLCDEAPRLSFLLRDYQENGEHIAKIGISEHLLELKSHADLLGYEFGNGDYWGIEKGWNYYKYLFKNNMRENNPKKYERPNANMPDFGF